jgi:hypothetical protein
VGVTVVEAFVGASGVDGGLEDGLEVDDALGVDGTIVVDAGLEGLGVVGTIKGL